LTDVHLDTSFLIRSLIAGTSERHDLREWLRVDRAVAISSVAWTEFLSGPVDQRIIAAVLRFVGDVSPFEREDAELAATLFNETGRRRRLLTDCMIAATALNRSASLATSNVRDFAKFEEFGLVVEPLR
jgi:predicted nucleic acid-binding protein